jgi:hypothetical protein
MHDDETLCYVAGVMQLYSGNRPNGARTPNEGLAAGRTHRHHQLSSTAQHIIDLSRQPVSTSAIWRPSQAKQFIVRIDQATRSHLTR